MPRPVALAALTLLLATSSAAAQAPVALTLDSPERTLTVTFALDAEGVPAYAVRRLGAEIVRPSRLGFAFRGAPPLERGLTLVEARRAARDTTWEQPWGETRWVRDRHTELRVELAETGARPRRMTVVFRAFEDGVGFRYELPRQRHLRDFEITDERTEFRLAGDPTTWSIPAYGREHYEYLYRRAPLSALGGAVHTPLTLETADGLYLALHEAALTDWSSMTLLRTDTTTLKADLVPWADGVLVRGRAPAVSPWRTLQVADTPGGLVTSYLALNLNEPSRIDPSPFRPQKYVGIWWGMHLGLYTWGQGPQHGATTARARQYVDFAAANGFGGVLVEGWNVGWDGDWLRNGGRFHFTRATGDFDLEGVAAYARERGVALVGHHETGGNVANYEAQMEQAFRLYRRLGVRAVKTGYVAFGRGLPQGRRDGEEPLEWHYGQFMVQHHQRVVEAAARHGLALDVHEGVKDTGLRRTWPNLMTRENARGQEYNSTGGPGNPPEHVPTLVFTRMLAGPMDYTPGIFALEEDGAEPPNKVTSTLAHQLALYVVLYSPLHMAADLPENYEGQPALRFIRDVPTDWAETRVLGGEIGRHVTIARRDRRSDDWYLGSVTDGTGRVLEAPLGFLDAGRLYVAEVYRDGDGADWRTAPLDVRIESFIVDAATVLPLRLAPGGGQAVRLRPALPEDEAALPRYARP